MEIKARIPRKMMQTIKPTKPFCINCVNFTSENSLMRLNRRNLH